MAFPKSEGEVVRDSGPCENSPALQRWRRTVKGSQVRETDDRGFENLPSLESSVAHFAGSVRSAVNLNPSAEALGYFHFVRFADDKARHPDFRQSLLTSWRTN